jgi:CheY-like chemotaxis protein
MGDPARLEQILTNLISNAIKFTMQGDVLVEVFPDPEENEFTGAASMEGGDMASIAGSVFPYLATDGFPGQMQMLVQTAGKTTAESSGDAEVGLVFRVSDSGIGMSRSTIRQLYQPFTQADSSTTRRFGGTGLGLAITHRLVEMLHGRISVESHEGKGSSFSCHIAFPLPEEDQDAGKGTPPFRALYGHGSVLIVEGSRMQSRILGHYLTTAGYDCVSADSAVDALSRMTGSRIFDFILLSTSLTDYPVQAFIELLRNLPAGDRVPILLLGSHAQRDPSAVRLGDQVQGTLTRPFRHHDLLLLMKSVHEREHAESTDASLSMQTDLIHESVKIQMPDEPEAPELAMESEGYDPTKGMRNYRFTDRFRDSGGLEDTVNSSGLPLPSILLVEDNPTNRIVFENLLRTYGLSCDTANDGMEAVMACEHHAYDIIFMDCQMPVMDGFAAARIIRGSGSSRKAVIIALTARILSSDRDKCLEAGMDEHIGKPITMAVLFARLDALMKQLGYMRPTKALPRTVVKTNAPVATGNPAMKSVSTELDVAVASDASMEPGAAAEAGSTGETDAAGWPEGHPATASIRILTRIPGMSRNEVIDLIHLFLQELAEIIMLQPTMTRDELTSRTHRLRGAAGSLQLLDFLSELTLLEAAARGGDQDGIHAARNTLNRMRRDWVDE